MPYVKKVWVNNVDKVDATNMNHMEDGVYSAVATAETALATGGPMGPQGPQGPAGAASTVPGPTGPQGAQGIQGVQGVKGDTGAQGPKGDKGDTGAQGTTGSTGAQGPTGPQGAGLTIVGTVPTASALPATPINNDDARLAVDTGHVWFWDETRVPPSWQDGGALQGAPGATGPQGPVGATGAQGPAGTAGATGSQGPAGAQGATGPGVAAGGTTGQMLVKTASGDYVTGWATPTVDVPRDDATPAATRIYANKLVGSDTQPAHRVLGDGKHEWGVGGTTAIDTNLYRGGADLLQSDDAFYAGGSIRARPFTAQQIVIGDPTNAKISFGSAFDVELTRTAADVLTTPDKFDPAAFNVPTKAGVPVDGDVVGGAANGDMIVDTTGKVLYVRIAGVWTSVGGGAAGGAALTYLGDWSAATSYVDGDIVVYNGVPYMTVRPNLNSAPAAWPITGGGVQGATGPQGAAGAQGANVVTLMDPSAAASAAATNLAATQFNAVSDPSYRRMMDLRGLTKMKIQGRIGGTLVAATKLRVQYNPSSNPAIATGDAGWATLATTAGSHTLNTMFYTAELAIPAGAQINDCQVRVGLYDGDGVADPTITCCILNIYP